MAYGVCSRRYIEFKTSQGKYLLQTNTVFSLFRRVLAISGPAACFLCHVIRSFPSAGEPPFSSSAPCSSPPSWFQFLTFLTYEDTVTCSKFLTLNVALVVPLSKVALQGLHLPSLLIPDISLENGTLSEISSHLGYPFSHLLSALSPSAPSPVE